MKKYLNIVLVGAIFFCLLIESVNALTKWEYSTWQDPEGYGEKSSTTSNITNLKGEPEENDGMKYGPYNKSSKAKLSDGITEEVYVGLNKNNYNSGDLFELSIALNNKTNEYLTEAVVMSQKSGDNFVLTANWAPKFKATITEDGVYTYRWEFKASSEGKIQVKFTVLDYGKEIATTDFQTLDKESKDATNVRYLWACNIKAPYGVDIYTQLPDKNNIAPQVTPDNQANDNPNTSDNILFYLLISLFGLSIIVYSAKKLKSMNIEKISR